jgi:hypothetical protein
MLWLPVAIVNTPSCDEYEMKPPLFIEVVFFNFQGGLYKKYV